MFDEIGYAQLIDDIDIRDETVHTKRLNERDE